MYFKAVVVFAITCCELVIVKLVIRRCCQDLPYAIFAVSVLTSAVPVAMPEPTVDICVYACT